MNSYKQVWVLKTLADLQSEREQRERQGAARADETCEQRNMRMGWGCSCHGMTFCPDEVLSHYDDDDVPVFVKQRS